MASGSGSPRVDTAGAEVVDLQYFKHVRNIYFGIAAFLVACFLISFAFTPTRGQEEPKPRRNFFENFQRVADGLKDRASMLEDEAKQAMSPEVADAKRTRALGIRLLAAIVLLLPAGFLYWCFIRPAQQVSSKAKAGSDNQDSAHHNGDCGDADPKNAAAKVDPAAIEPVKSEVSSLQCIFGGAFSGVMCAFLILAFDGTLILKIVFWALVLLIIVVGLLSAAIAWSNIENISWKDKQDGKYTFYGVLFSCAFLPLLYSHTGTGRSRVETVEAPRAAARTYLEKEELKLAAVTLRGEWLEEDTLENQSAQWSGTAFATEANESNIYLFTNKHCLNLESLAAADSGDSPEILAYRLWVEFPSGARRPVTRIAVTTSSLDLARLEVPSDGLKAGVDFVFISTSAKLSVTSGDSVVAVGNPLGLLEGSRTYGRVSDFRTYPEGAQTRSVIQHGAAVNQGNSGGPLFLERDDKYYWIGVNTWTADPLFAQGIYFSIAAVDVRKADFKWVGSDPAGVATLFHGQP